MRKETRRKLYARGSVASALRSAANELQQAIELSEKPLPETPLSVSLKNIVKTLERAIEYEKLYQLGRKRIKKSMEREKKAIEQLLQEVQGVPVTKDEKIIKKVGQSKSK